MTKEPQQPVVCPRCQDTKTVLKTPKGARGNTHYWEEPCPKCSAPQQPEGEMATHAGKWNLQNDLDDCFDVHEGKEKDCSACNPQQPEGNELASYPEVWSLDTNDKDVWKQACEAQRTHMIQQGYRKLPSEGRIEEMLKQGKRVRLWYGQRLLDRDCISNEWVVMDSKGNKGLGDCLYSGASLDKALDALEARP